MFMLWTHGVGGDLHSFPTRRSSDLKWRNAWWRVRGSPRLSRFHSARMSKTFWSSVRPKRIVLVTTTSGPSTGCWEFSRSEEHTSELQSRLHLVCRLLLEKKNHRRQV